VIAYRSENYLFEVMGLVYHVSNILIEAHTYKRGAHVLY
jgi:hypothetical protein